MPLPAGPFEKAVLLSGLSVDRGNPKSAPSGETYRALEAEILSFMAGSRESGGHRAAFEDLSRRVFAFQFAHNAPYANYCRSLGIETADAVSSWQEIPAVPGEAFRDATVFRENLDSRKEIESALRPCHEDSRRRTGKEDP